MHIDTKFRMPSRPANSNANQLLASMQPAAVTFFAPDEVIYAQGESAGPMYYVEFGTVRICRLTADGRRQISAFHFAGDVFGFEAGDEHGSYAESVDGAGIRVLRKSCGAAPEGNMLSLVLKGLTRAQEHLLLLGRRNAQERMASFLLDLADRQGTGTAVHLPMSRNDIADYLGVTFETVSRIFRAFKDQHLIRLTAITEIDLLDAPALETMCE